MKPKLIELIKRNKKLLFLAKLIINIVIILSVWYLFYKIIRPRLPLVDYLYEEVIFWVTELQLVLSKLLLNLIGYSVEIYGKTVKIIGSFGVHLDRGCLGRNTLGLFVGFILAFPGKIKNKVWFLIMGIGIFIIVNVLRIAGLAITEFCCPERLDFNHHYLFKIIVYIIIFFLWVWWIQKYSMFAKKRTIKK